MDVGTPWEAIMLRVGVVTGKNYYLTRPFPESERYYFERDLAIREHGSRRAVLDVEALPEFDRATWHMMGQYLPTATVPAGSELTVDRVYIRQGAKEYSSLSFLVTDAGPFGDRLAPVAKRGFKKAHRFWAKLRDCRRIEASVDYADVPEAGSMG
jgi:hypothetical protein